MASINDNSPRPPRHRIRRAEKTRPHRGRLSKDDYPYNPRYRLAFAILALVGLAAVVAVAHPNGMAIFDKLLPTLIFVLSRCFPQEVEHELHSSDKNERRKIRRS